ncbi:MAG TPA: hypothetical protein VF220_05435 [Nitrososphaeraceae archaeon]
MRYLIVPVIMVTLIFNWGIIFGDANFTVDCSHVKYPNDTEKAIAIMRYCTDAEKEVQ